MTKYIIELYGKGARKPYETFTASLPDKSHPTFTNSKECFEFKLSHCGRVKVRYASNHKLAAEKYMDVNGNGRLRWHKM